MSQVGNTESVVDVGNAFVTDEAPIEFGVVGVICLPPKVGIVGFQVTSPMLHLRQMNGFFRGQTVEDKNWHFKFCVVFLHFTIWNISQESIRLWLLLFSLIYEATSCLVEFFQGSIRSWAE